mmetsp:Transcript_6086/g.17094  ORF Transcript_6086/g.17094 Transcript_6086/m.17094 type:complete len:139 (+) Transcript_6086:1876-2292(+)
MVSRWWFLTFIGYQAISAPGECIGSGHNKDFYLILPCPSFMRSKASIPNSLHCSMAMSNWSLGKCHETAKDLLKDGMQTAKAGATILIPFGWHGRSQIELGHVPGENLNDAGIDLSIGELIGKLLVGGVVPLGHQQSL